MKTKSEYKYTAEETALFEDAECKTNRDNAIYFLILAPVLIFCNILNEIDVFDVAPIVMRVGTVLGTIVFLIPTLVLSKALHIFRRPKGKLVYKIWHKYFIMAFAWLGTAIICITFTHHTVILMAVPIMIMAQYRNTVKLVYLTLILGTICVLLGVYGGFFVGCFDANLLHREVNEEIINDLSFRLELATPERMFDLLTHYAIAREFIILALTLLASKISKRNDEMLKRQAELQSVAETEMQRTNEIQRQIIDGMANLIENRDTSTGEHVKRTSFYVKSIIDRLRVNSVYGSELNDDKSEIIVRAAPLHDIGKIVISDRILQKPGRLTPEEYEEIKHHASEGARVIANVLGCIEDEEFLNCATEIAVDHHERWDGNGYPRGLNGNKIPLSARIMSVADVFDALVSKRVYKEPMTFEEAFNIIQAESGKQFDPEIVRAFVEIKPVIEIYLNNSNYNQSKLNAV